MYEKELEFAIKTAKEASEIVRKIYFDNSAIVQIKSDDSPVTQADLLSEKLIRSRIIENYPEYGILSEETEDNLIRLSKDYVWIVDPIDGTKDYVERTGEFTINIALSYKGEIVVGVIMIPVKNEVFFASKGNGSFREVDGKIYQNHVSEETENLILLGSRFHRGPLEIEYYEKHKDVIKEFKTYGSSYKACKIACGEAHIYMKAGKGTKEWDVAPMAIIIKEAGGIFLTAKGNEMRFNKEDVYNNEGFFIINKMNQNLLI